MLLGENENRELILSHFADHFALAKDLLCDVVATQSALMKAAGSSSRPPVVVYLALGFLAQSLRRFRSIVLLCEHGYLENAEILDQSLFETLLAVRFVLRKPKRISTCSPDLQAARRKLPPIPRRSQACEFRAALYIASDVVRFHRLGEDISRVPGNRRVLNRESRRKMQEAANEAEQDIGPQWRRILQRGSFSGLTVKQLAECYGLQDHHLKLYGVQSSRVHAGGGCDFIDFGPDGVKVQNATNVARLPTVLHLAAGVLLIILGDVDQFVGLGMSERLRPRAVRMRSLAGSD